LTKLVNIIKLIFGSQLLSSAATHLVGIFIYSFEMSGGCLYAAVPKVAIIVAIYSLLVESCLLYAAMCYVMTLVTQTHSPAASTQQRAELTQYYGKFL
jgi:hypothetical protein